MSAEILVGHRVVEVRARGVSKGGYVAGLFPRGRDRHHAVLAIGDDLTDQEMYAALPAGAVSVHVGTRRPTGPSRHKHLIPEPAAARALLREIVVDALRRMDETAA